MSDLIQRTIVPTIAMIWATAYFFEVSKLPAENGYLIRPAFYIMLLLYVINTTTEYMEWKKKKATEKNVARKMNPEEKNNLIVLGITFLITVVYVGLMSKLGFIISTIIYLFLQLYILKTKNKLVLFGLPIILSLVVFFMFTEGFSVPLPRGIFGL
ncbi:MAG: tripartite tricarboxylate transporter TctB family protein [Neofamilia sp.]